MPDHNDIIILKKLRTAGQTTSGNVARLFNISRQAAHRRLSRLTRERRLIKVGQTRSSYYIPYSVKRVKELKPRAKALKLILKNKNLQEDLLYDRIELSSDTLKPLSVNTKGIFRYAFTEMLNNAIEHSHSAMIKVNVVVSNGSIHFTIADRGVGIYNNLKKKYNLKNDYEALQELLKGKRTTEPKKHSGEGIFFTSKIADLFKIEAASIRLTIDNLAKDILTEEIPRKKGTKVFFQINKQSRKNLEALFNEYTNEEFAFSKTRVTVKLYEHGVAYVSRSQARRILFGLDKFQTIVLDFAKIKGIGQSFADEIFRVFQSGHPQISLVPVNTGQAVLFMIKRAQAH